jgi:uroporphyrinogen decarboxylase
MLSRERILIAMDGGKPDRVPCALGFYRVDMARLAPPGEHWQELLDVQYVKFPISPEERELSLIARPYSGDTRLGNVSQVTTYTRWKYRPQNPDHRNPLSLVHSLGELRDFPFPDTSNPYQVKDLGRQVEQLHERGQAAGGNLPHLGGELFEAAWRLRGLENFLIDLVKRPDWAHYLLDRLTDMAKRNAGALAQAGIDVLSLDDDIGMPCTMMISPDTWRTFFKARLETIIRAAREIQPELRVLFHSDGYFEPIVGDLMEIGVNAINPLQPEHMDAVSIRKRYGKKLALWGTVGSQTAFSFNTPEQIRREVRLRVETLGRAGLILCPAYDIDEPDIPRENIAAFLRAVREYG